MKLLGIVIVVLTNLSLYSGDVLCASTLSREKAAAVINERMSKSEVKIKIALNSNGFQKGLQQGMWVWGGGPNLSETFAQLTERGKEIFQDIDYRAYFQQGPGSITLKKPANVRIKVTGIAKGSVAEFTWEYVALPSIVKRYVVRGGGGQADFALYDDGWRLKGFYHNYSDEPAPLTAKDRAEEAKDTQKWIEQQNALYEKKIVERQRILNLLKESKTPTQDIKQLKFQETYDGTYDSGVIYTTIKVSDVGYSWEKEIHNTDKRWNPPTQTTSHESGAYGFGDIGFRTSGGEDPIYLKPIIKSVWKKLKEPIKKGIVIFDSDWVDEPTGNHELNVFARFGNAPDRFISDNPDDTREAYNILNTAYTQWRERYTEIVKMIEIESKNAYLHFPESLTDSAWEKFGK